MISPTVPPGEGALEAELLRNLLDTVAHDLGGLASALALRADVMQHAATSTSASACRAIASELRTLGTQLRELSAPRGGDTLSPTPVGSLDHWFELLSRFAQPLLGRGVALRGEVPPVHVGSVAVHELTYIALALLHAMRELPASTHTEVLIDSELTPQAIAISMSIRNALQALSLDALAESRWTRWAVQRSASTQIDLTLDGARITLLVPIERQ